jgi:penicillin-binding protein 1A
MGARETGGGLALPVWIDFMQHALRGVPVQEPAAPEGVQPIDGDWVYDEFAGDNGVTSLGLDEAPQAPNEDERKSILDLFKR